MTLDDIREWARTLSDKIEYNIGLDLSSSIEEIELIVVDNVRINKKLNLRRLMDIVNDNEYFRNNDA